MARKRISVTRQTQSGRNLSFKINRSNRTLTRTQLVKRIENGGCPGYHVRRVHGVKTPVSNPDGRTGNNLG